MGECGRRDVAVVSDVGVWRRFVVYRVVYKHGEWDGGLWTNGDGARGVWVCDERRARGVWVHAEQWVWGVWIYGWGVGRGIWVQFERRIWGSRECAEWARWLFYVVVRVCVGDGCWERGDWDGVAGVEVERVWECDNRGGMDGDSGAGEWACGVGECRDWVEHAWSVFGHRASRSGRVGEAGRAVVWVCAYKAIDVGERECMDDDVAAECGGERVCAADGREREHGMGIVVVWEPDGERIDGVYRAVVVGVVVGDGIAL